jgi:hypothetical protein
LAINSIAHSTGYKTTFCSASTDTIPDTCTKRKLYIVSTTHNKIALAAETQALKA